jgi:hypothetical protein
LIFGGIGGIGKIQLTVVYQALFRPLQVNLWLTLCRGRSQNSRRSMAEQLIETVEYEKFEHKQILSVFANGWPLQSAHVLRGTVKTCECQFQRPRLTVRMDL